jgi:hypothetical protein
LREREADVVHLHDGAHEAVDDDRDQHRDDGEDDRPGDDGLVDDLLEGDDHDLGGEDEVRPDGAGDHRLLGLRPGGDGRHVVVLAAAEGLEQLVRSLVAEVGAADHEDDLDEGGGDRAQHERDREDEEQLVPERPDGDALDDRELALGCEALDVGRGHRGVVHDDAGRLHAGAACGGADVIDRRGCELRQRGDVVEQADQTTSHHAPPSPSTGQEGTGLAVRGPT